MALFTFRLIQTCIMRAIQTGMDLRQQRRLSGIARLEAFNPSGAVLDSLIPQLMEMPRVGSLAIVLNPLLPWLRRRHERDKVAAVE